MISRKKNLLITTAIISALSIGSARAEDDLEALMQMPLKELMKMEVTSVSKRAEKANQTAAALFVITQEDIRRSGSNNIPEVLRMVPGMQVARIDSNRWAISTRGFGEQFAKKLLVLIDGRSVYTPLFSGVYWDEQGVPMEDIERIEVIRGPGSTLYGANAVNGVINIITKSAAESQGNLAVAGAGNFERDYALLRHGGKIDEDTKYRAYVQRFDVGGSKTESGDTKDDDWSVTRSGFRADGKMSEKENFTVQGDFYKSDINDEYDQLPSTSGAPNAKGYLVISNPDDENVYGGNILGRYTKKLEKDSELSVQTYYDLSSRDYGFLGDVQIQNFDVDMQHSFNLSNDHEFIWGLGYRLTAFDLTGSNYFRFNSGTNESTNLFSGFVQDKIQIVPDKFFLTVGSKVEHNDYTGVEVQPNARLTWLADEDQTVWASVTRAVRSPSHIEANLTQITAAVPGPAYVGLVGSDQMDSEKLIAYELGYKVTPSDDVSIDVTGFINDYSELRSLENNGGIAPDIAASFLADNKASGKVAGIELAGNWEVSNNWSLSGSYSYLDMNIKIGSDSSDTLSEVAEDQSPQNMFNIRSHYIFNSDWELDNALYYNEAIKGSTSFDTHNVPSYIRLDAKVTYRPMDGVETSLVGQNLLEDQHQEYGSGIWNSISEVPRSVFGKVTVRF